MVDNNVILDHAVMRGLYLVVFNRFTLKKEFSGVYDLMALIEPTDVNINLDKVMQNYTFDATLFNYTVEPIQNVSYVRVYNNENAHKLARKI